LFELLLQSAQLAFALGVRIRLVTSSGSDRLLAGFHLASPRFERIALPLELDTVCGELLLDESRLLGTLLELCPLGACELPLGLQLAGSRLGEGESGGELALPLLDPLRLGLEAGGAVLELALARLERLRAFERRTFPGDERLRGDGGGKDARLLFLLGATGTLELLELALAGADCLGPLAERLLERLELGDGVPLLGVAPLGELPCEPEDSLAVEVDPGLVGRPRAARRPAVESLLPA